MPPEDQGVTAADGDLTDQEFARISAIAHVEAGLHLPESKRAMVRARLLRRMSRLRIASFSDYADLISQSGAPERRRMVATLTTNVSSFFREPHHFAALRERILPTLLAACRQGERLRIWSAGCANGQEAYSIALTLLDLDPEIANYDVRILGTDIDPSVVRFAQMGTYHSSMMGELPERFLDRYFSFDASSNTHQATELLRSFVTFRELNLHGPWPMPGRFNIIFCRNVVIYFDEDGQNALWTRFEEKLEDNGWLLVGHSERVAASAAPNLKLKDHTIYQNTGVAPRA